MAVVWCYTYTVPSQSKMAHGIHCCSMNRPKPEKLQTQAPKLLKLAVSGATQLLSLLSPPHKHRLDELNSEGGNIELSVSDVEDVLTIIKDDYEREYFVTGLFTSAIYAEDCTFEDPTIKFRGRDLYSRNLKLLVPFFDNPSIKLEKIEKGANSNADFIMATWKLRTYLKLPWKPLISVNGCTVYDLDRQLRVVRHVESWDISALEAIGQIFTPGFQREETRGNTYGMEEMHMEIGLLCSDMNHRMNIIEGSFAESFTAVLQIGDTGTDLVGWLARAYLFFSNRCNHDDLKVPTIFINVEGPTLHRFDGFNSNSLFHVRSVYNRTSGRNQW